MNANVIAALKTLQSTTSGSFDFWRLAGPHGAKTRAQIMSELYGRKVPQAKAGVTAMREAFFMLAYNHEVFQAAQCIAAREEAFVAWAQSQLVTVAA